MALQAAVLEGALKTIFAAMRDGSKDDDWYAEELAAAITNQIKTAGIPSGAVIVGVTGQAAGVPNPAPINVA
jgi:hypothetical protein